MVPAVNVIEQTLGAVIMHKYPVPDGVKDDKKYFQQVCKSSNLFMCE